MELDHLIAFNFALMVAIASPGPAMLYAVRATLIGGRAVGVATGCGLGLMAAGWTLAALLGLDGLFKLFPWAYTTFKIVGALYLLYIAWITWRGASEPVLETDGSRDNTTERAALVRAFWTGFLVNLANPKSVLFAAAVLVVIFPPGLTALEKTIIVGNHLVIELAAYTAFALLLSTGAARSRYLRAKPVLDRVSAAVLGILGLKLILEK